MGVLKEEELYNIGLDPKVFQESPAYTDTEMSKDGLIRTRLLESHGKEYHLSDKEQYELNLYRMGVDYSKLPKESFLPSIHNSQALQKFVKNTAKHLKEIQNKNELYYIIEKHGT